MEQEGRARPSHPCLAKWEQRSERIGCRGTTKGGAGHSGPALGKAEGAGAQEELGSASRMKTLAAKAEGFWLTPEAGEAPGPEAQPPSEP